MFSNVAKLHLSHQFICSSRQKMISEEFSTRTYSCQCEPGQDSSLWHENLELTTICPTLENYDSEISTPVRPPRSWLPWTNWSIGAKLESSSRHKESYVCVPPNVKSIYAALMMYSRNQGSITNLTKHFPPHTQTNGSETQFSWQIDTFLCVSGAK